MNRCIFCSRRISIQPSLTFLFSFKRIEKSLLCRSCSEKFDRIHSETACPSCSRKQESKKKCLECQEWQKNYPRFSLKHFALFAYNESAKEYMQQFKFEGDLVLSKVFAEEMYSFLKQYEKSYHIIPIPISPESRNVRGFNQVELMLEQAGIEYENWLTHLGNVERQATKNRKERLFSKQAFKVNLQVSEANKINKPILIIDDVYTTGRTLLHAKDAFYNFIQQNIDLKNQLNKQSIEIESFSLFR